MASGTLLNARDKILIIHCINQCKSLQINTSMVLPSFLFLDQRSEVRQISTDVISCSTGTP